MDKVVDDGGVILYRGDAMDILPLLDEVDCIVTDPPYGEVSLAWDVPVRGWLDAASLSPAGSAWIFGSLRSFMAMENLGAWRLAQDVVWEKHNGSNFHADRFRRVHEIAAHFYRGAWSDIYKAPVTTNDATARTVRRKERPPHTGEIAGSSYASEDGGPRLQRSVMLVRSCHGSALHPTQKPLGILRPLIEYSCPLGGVVLDPFCGSGSTLVAARESGRRAIGIELDPRYVAIAAARLEQKALFVDG